MQLEISDNFCILKLSPVVLSKVIHGVFGLPFTSLLHKFDFVLGIGGVLLSLCTESYDRSSTDRSVHGS